MKWKALLFTALLALIPGRALASTVVTWTGNGAENLPCQDGGHWVLSPAQGITSAVFTVNGVSYTMEQNGGGSWAADSTGALDSTLTATATYEGDNDTAFLKLSHCTDSGPTESPTPTPTPSPSPTDSPTPPPSPSGSPSTPPSSHHTHSHTPQPTHQPRTHSPSTSSASKHVRKTAYTGSRAIVPAAAATGLLTLGLLAMYVARRRAGMV